MQPQSRSSLGCGQLALVDAANSLASQHSQHTFHCQKSVLRHVRPSSELSGIPGNSAPLRMAEKTLQSMAAGGVYDHIGGGFHRYSVDEHWHVPHFEKVSRCCFSPSMVRIRCLWHASLNKQRHVVRTDST